MYYTRGPIMFARDLVTAYMVGFFAGIGVSAAIAAWLWVHLSDAWKGKATPEQLDQKVIEDMIEEGR